MADEATATEEVATEQEEKRPGYEKFTTKASKDENARSLTMEYHIGETVEEATEKFGDEIVLNYFGAQLVVQIQAAIRRMMNPKEEGKHYTDEKIIDYITNEYKPGVKTGRVGVTKIDSLVKKFKGMSPEKQAEFLAKLSEGQAA